MTTTQRCADCQHPEQFHRAGGAPCVGYQHSPLAPCVCTEFAAPGSTSEASTVWLTRAELSSGHDYLLGVFATAALAMQAAEQHSRADMLHRPIRYEDIVREPGYRFQWKDVRKNTGYYTRVNPGHSCPNYMVFSEPVRTHIA